MGVGIVCDSKSKKIGKYIFLWSISIWYYIVSVENRLHKVSWKRLFSDFKYDINDYKTYLPTFLLQK